MPKPLAIFLMIIFLVGGILLGNQYGRRDLQNSHPAQISGEVGVPGAVVVNTDERRLGSYFIYDKEKSTIFGALSLMSKSTASEAVIYLWNSEVGEFGNRFIVTLFDANNNKIREITTFDVNDNTTVVRFVLPAIEPGQYLGLVLPGENEPSLISETL